MVDCFEVPRLESRNASRPNAWGRILLKGGAGGWSGRVQWYDHLFVSFHQSLPPYFGVTEWKFCPKNDRLMFTCSKSSWKHFIWYLILKKKLAYLWLILQFQNRVPPVISWEKACVKETTENSWWSSVPNVIECERSTFCSNICGTK